jgi:hypothetical protein
MRASRNILILLIFGISVWGISAKAQVRPGTQSPYHCEVDECLQWVYSIPIHGGIRPPPTIQCKPIIKGRTSCVAFSTTPRKTAPEITPAVAPALSPTNSAPCMPTKPAQKPPTTGGNICLGPQYECSDNTYTEYLDYCQKNYWIPNQFGGGRIAPECLARANAIRDKKCWITNPDWENCKDS